MPRSLLIIVLLLPGCFVAVQRAEAADDYPYTAYVTKPQAEVLSGPARKFYLTHQLYAGDEVQVYKRDAAGWLGIRPPEDSFSWVPADVVEPTDDEGIHRVLVDTPSWIGTSLEAIESQNYKYQVRLRPGELVEVIGEKQLRTREGNETWFKIAPPAGEFRWIHTRDVSRSPPRETDLAQAQAEKTKRPGRQGRNPQDDLAAIGTGVDRVKESLASFRSFERAPTPANAPPAMNLKDLESARTEAREAEEIRLAQHEQPVKINRNPGPAGDGFVPRKPRKLENSAGVPAPSADLRMASREQLQNSIRETTAPTRSTTTASATTSTASFNAASATEALKQLDVELSLHLSQPRELWNLEPLRKQVQEFVDKGSSPQERGQARLLLEKIRKFEETFESPNDPLLAARTANASSSPAAPRYDGVGLLQPVLSRAGQNTVAPYAIVDADGNPVAFVTPGKGLDLRRYENKPVGIYGKRGLIESLKKPHLVAERVIDLSTR